LRQAYGTLGPWLFGKAISTFADLAALTDTLDSPVEAGEFMGAGTFRQNQIRYTYLLPNGMSSAVAVEAAVAGGNFLGPTGFGNGGLGYTDFQTSALTTRVPAFVWNFRVDQPWGHNQAGVAVEQERLQSPVGFAAVPGGAHFKRWGYQLEDSGHLNTFGKDKATWAFGYGQGAAQFSWPLTETDIGPGYLEGLMCYATNGATNATVTSFECHEPREMGINAGYSHFWTNEWRSGIGVGWDQISNPYAGVTPGSAEFTPTNLSGIDHRHYSVSVATFWTPVPGMQLAIGYLWYHRVVWSGAQGDAMRLSTQALFRF
jgi:hypothetical protein